MYKQNQQNQDVCDRLEGKIPKCDIKTCTEMVIIHKGKTSKTSTINHYAKNINEYFTAK